MANNEDLLKKIIAHAKEYGFVFQSSEKDKPLISKIISKRLLKIATGMFT